MSGSGAGDAGGRSRSRSRQLSSGLSDDDALFSLGDDLALEVLYRLPAKSLFRFKCVCRRWRSVISDRTFPDRYRRRHESTSCAAGCFLYQLRYSNPKFPGVFQVSIVPHNPYADNIEQNLRSLKLGAYRVTVTDSDSGLLLCSDNWHKPRHFFVCNPLTKQCVTVPDPPEGSPACPKLVIRREGSFLLVSPPYQKPRLRKMWVLTFCSDTGEWKEAGHVLPIEKFDFAPGRPVLLGDTIYWPSSGLKQGFAHDLAEGRLWLVDFPGNSESCGKNCLSVSGGTLYYIHCDNNVLHLWACIGQGGDQTMWLHKHTVDVSEMFLDHPAVFANIKRDMSTVLTSIFPLGLHNENPHLLYLRFPRIIIVLDLHTTRLTAMYSDNASLDDHFLRSCILPLALPVWPTVVPEPRLRL